MNVAELVWRVRESGAELRLTGPTGLELRQSSLVDPATVAQIRANRDAVREFLTENRADAIVHAYALRHGRFLPEKPPCSFHIGYTHEGCKRCRASLAKHYQERDEAAGDR